MDYSVYLIYQFFAWVFRILPKFIIKHLLDLIAWIAYWVDRKHYRIAKANLDLAFGNRKSDAEKERIIRSSFLNMVYNLYEFMVLQHTPFEEMQKKMSVENEEILLKLLEGDKPIITVSGHYGCWELSLPYFAMQYKPLTIISRKLNNPYLNKIFTKARHRQQLNMCEKKGAAKCMVKALRSGRVVAVTIDQSIKKSLGVEVNFFGHKAIQVDSPVRLATRLDAVILPLYTIREGFEKHRLIFGDPVEVKQNMNDDEIVHCSQKLSDMLEKQIRKRPQDWFWQHRRWKVYYPELYKKRVK